MEVIHLWRGRLLGIPQIGQVYKLEPGKNMQLTPISNLFCRCKTQAQTWCWPGSTGQLDNCQLSIQNAVVICTDQTPQLARCETRGRGGWREMRTEGDGNREDGGKRVVGTEGDKDKRRWRQRDIETEGNEDERRWAQTDGAEANGGRSWWGQRWGQRERGTHGD